MAAAAIAACTKCDATRLIQHNSATHPPLQGSRYDDNIAVFGRTLQQKMESLKIFLVREGERGEGGLVGC